MQARDVLVVDDEKNIRLTLSETLRGMGLHVDTAADGREALARLEEKDYWLVLLDIRMPGLDGLEVLGRLREIRPAVLVVIITAHGTVENAVEAMKLGAVDFLQKPFSPKGIRAFIRAVEAREQLDPEKVEDYQDHLALARRAITRQQFEAAHEHVRKALSLGRQRPEAYNLLGVLRGIEGDRLEAQQLYRQALEQDPTYEPALANLHQSVEPGLQGSFLLGEVKKGNVAKSSPQE